VVLLRYYDVVGYLLYRHEKDRVTIMHVAVSPEYQRKGGGTDMVKFVLDGYSKAKTVKPIEVMLREDASDAQSFFRATGFKVSAIRKQHFKNGDDGYLMRKVPERTQVDQQQV
jgi:ribosomal protein S18 acetylase RimI-like enzyme